MTTPSERLTQRAAAFLDEPVVLAVRLRWDPAATDRTDNGQLASAQRSTGPVDIAGAGLPIVPLVRSVKNVFRSVLEGDSPLDRVLAFTRSGDRVLTGSSSFLSVQLKQPVERLASRVPIMVNMPLLAKKLIPEIELDGKVYVVNSVDFGALTRAVSTGQLFEPELAAQLRGYYEQTRAMAAQDPQTMASMIGAQSRKRRRAKSEKAAS